MAAAGTILGPIDRVSFVAEQKRRRAQTWRLGAVCLLGALFIGFIASTVISPLVLALLGGCLRLGAALFGLPWLGETAQAMRRWAGHRVEEFLAMGDQIDKIHGLSGALSLLPTVEAMLVFLLPGIGAMLIAYAALYRLLRRTTGPALLVALQARPPREGDLEERQAQNIVEEIAVAAGVAPPRLMLVDAEIANAAALPVDGGFVVVATRGLLDRLSRDESQGIIGHLIASIGNGDMRLMISILATFETLGFMLTLLDLPLRASARRAMGRLIGLAFLRGDRSAEAAAVADLLAAGASPDSSDEVGRFLGQNEGASRLRKILTFPLLPYALLTLLMKAVLWLWVSLLLGALISLLWRNRRYLADASAVQLTRNPEGLSAGLLKLAQCGGMPAGGDAADFMFVDTRHVGARGPDRRNFALSLAPPLDSRRRRLVALGATPFASRRHWVLELPLGPRLLLIALVAVLVPLFAALFIALGYLSLIVVALGTAFGAIIMRLALG